MENVTLKIEGSAGEIILREGEAAPPVVPRALSLSGDIRSVRTFIDRRRDNETLQEVTTDHSIIQVNNASRTITLDTDPNSEYNSKVVGKLELSDELKVFRVNEGKVMTQKEIVEILKFNSPWFKDKDEWKSVYDAYRFFSYKAESEGSSNAKDGRGNSAASFSKAVQTNLPQTFVLKLPIFKGEDEKIFLVEICFDATDAGCRFWLESTELHELMIIERGLIFERELNGLDDLVIIYQ